MGLSANIAAFGTLFVGIPVVCYLLIVHLLVDQFRFPWSALAYLVLVAAGLMIYAAVQGFHFDRAGCLTLISTAAVPLAGRIVRAISQPL